MPGSHGSVRLPAGFSPTSRPAAPDTSGTGRATRAVTRPGARLPDTGGTDDLRERWCRYARGRRARRALADARSTLEGTLLEPHLLVRSGPVICRNSPQPDSVLVKSVRCPLYQITCRRRNRAWVLAVSSGGVC